MKKLLTVFLIIFFPIIARAQTFNNSTGGAIPDNNTLTCYPVTVSGLPSLIDTSFGIISACINIAHPYDSDLRIYLKAPNGFVIDLSSTNGGSGDDYTSCCFRMDGLSGPVTFGLPPFTGTWIPEQSLNLFNTGIINPNGDWFLCALDEVPNDSGSVISFDITFGNSPPHDPAPPTGICSTTDASGCACPVSGDTVCDLMPDMTASALEILNDHIESPGYIDMSNATPNIGYGPLEVRGTNQCFCDTMQVPCTVSMCPDSSGPTEIISQRIYHKNGGTMTYTDVTAGTMTYHPSHGHIHVDDWASYSLRIPTSDPDARNWPIVGLGTKTSYCLVNLGDCNTGAGICADTGGTVYNQGNLPNYGLGAVSGCGTEQGIYVGSYDVYSAILDGQRILIPNVCNNDYFIVSITDPDNHFIEKNENNNWVAVPVTLTQQPGSTPVSAFSYAATGMNVSFFNNATGNNVYRWSFGDGQVDSSGQSLSHTYQSPGTYVVVLSVDNGICQASSAQLVTVPGSVNVNEPVASLPKLKIAPNPSSGAITFSYEQTGRQKVKLELFDPYGKLLMELADPRNDAGKHEFRLEKNELVPGVYFARLTADERSETSRIVILK